MQITLIPSDPHGSLLISLFLCIKPFVATDLQVSPELISRAGSELGDTERIRNGSEETLVGPALVLTRGSRKRDQQGMCRVLGVEQLPLVIPSCAFRLCILIADRNLRCNVAFASAVVDKRPEYPARV